MEMTIEFNQIFVSHSIIGLGLCDRPSGIIVSGEIVIDDIHIDNDGIGSYEYWGATGFDHGTDYVADFTVISINLEDCEITEVGQDRLTLALINDSKFQEAVFKQLNN